MESEEDYFSEAEEKGNFKEECINNNVKGERETRQLKFKKMLNMFNNFR